MHASFHLIDYHDNPAHLLELVLNMEEASTTPPSI